MAKASRDKGKRREREFRDLLREAGYCKARRGQQFSGEQGNPDVICPEMPEVLWEVKGDNQVTVFAVMSQARADAKPGQLPIGVIKRDLKPWFAVMEIEVLFEILRRSDLVK